ncbi:MAG: hypothetical protein SCH66_02445 [Methanolobus sp.]|nr:hypothetical protein [Methanolobus sp.]
MSKIPEELFKLQEQGRQVAIKNLKDVHGLIEKLVRKTYMNNEMDANSSLRNIRSDVSRLISEMGAKGLSSFNGKEGRLEDFYEAENRFVDDSVAFLEFANISFLSQDAVDVFSLEAQLDQFERSLNSRIIVDKNVLDEFKAKQLELDAAPEDMSGPDAGSGEKESGNPGTFMGVTSEKVIPSEINTHPFGVIPSENAVQKEGSGTGIVPEELDAETLSRLYNYFNLLEHKYSSYRPEISNDGGYIGDRNWSFEVSDRRIMGVVKDGFFRNLLHFETYWHPMGDLKETMLFVQLLANAVPKNQFQSLCLVNLVWSDEIKVWAKGFMHPRLMILLYELNTDYLIFNESLDAAKNLYVWHNAERKTESLEEKLQDFIEDNEYFDAQDIAGETGLNIKGAEKFLLELVSRKKIINIGFGTARYTRSKLE